jgi:uncharacterized protein YfcZ (UPF0381/DUF406 family)
MFKFFIFSLSVFIFASHAMAFDNDQSIEQKLAALKMEKKQAEVMLKKMVKSGRMTEEEAGHIKREIASVKEEDTKAIRVEALEKLKFTNSFATK